MDLETSLPLLYPLRYQPRITQRMKPVTLDFYYHFIYTIMIKFILLLNINLTVNEIEF